MRIYTTSLLLLTCLLLMAVPPVHAQEGALPEDAQSVGMIKGTSLQKGEFRAMAYTQMLAVALNAHAYYLENNAYPKDYYELYNSGAWNLDIQNIFSGQPVDTVYYDPENAGKTNLPPMGLMTELRPLDTTPQLSIDMPSGPQDPQNPIETPLVVNGGPLRIDASAVPSPVPGDVLYYTDGQLLQLVIWAPDGTFVEYVANTPDKNWLSIMGLNAADYTWPFDVYAAEVLLFSEELLPQYYSLYRYMANAEDIPRHQMATWSAADRIGLAQKMHIVIWNPYTKAPIKASESASKGDFLMEAGSPPSPLAISIDGGKLLTLADARESVGNAPGSSNPIFGIPGEDPEGSKDQKPKRKSKRRSFGAK